MINAQRIFYLNLWKRMKMTEKEFKDKYNFRKTKKFVESCGTCDNCHPGLTRKKIICVHKDVDKYFEIINFNFVVCDGRVAL